METMMAICTITMLFNIALMLGLVKEMGELHKEVGKLDIQMFCINRKYDRAKADGSGEHDENRREKNEQSEM